MKPRDKLKPSKKEGKICKICVGCQRHYYIYPSQNRRGRKYCSRKCMLSLGPRNCEACGMPFMVSKKSKKKICGSKCPAFSIEYDCIVCEKTVVRPRAFGYGLYCSYACRLIDVGEAAEILRGGISKPINTKRDAQVRDGDAIDKYDVFEFYDWKCIVCDEYIDKELRWPDPASATLEHVIPLSRGGTHTWDNVAPAHLLCNDGKQDEVDEEIIDRHKERWYDGISWQTGYDRPRNLQ